MLELDQKLVYEWALGIDSHLDSVPSWTVDPPAQAAVTFVDGSDPLFSIYNEISAEHDRKVAENWRSDADSAIIAVRRQICIPAQ